ncbi:MAG TPA: TRAP transporter substrate-binding protein [Candidatus Methylomirabilis sp.]|nr:TRAP transporter substrate-binding protein [Candidatus Methylomirabilis sp.]HSB78315.1 TRAP transporter substrate-binding protein [Candidatus Methylomirabilis sp.]
MKRWIVGAGVSILGLVWLAGAAAAQEVTLRAGIMVSKDYPFTKGAQYFADKVKERTGGRVKVDVYPDGVLGSEIEMFEQLRKGALDIVVTSPGNLAPFFKEMDLLDLPFLFKDHAHRDAVANGSVGKRYGEELERKGDVVVLGYFGGSVRNMICRTKSINSIDDIQGIKMRVWQSSVVIDTWKALGTVPSVVAYAEVYNALQTGVVECAENESLTFTTAKWAEAAKTVALTQHSVTIRPFLMSAKNLAKLSRADQDMVRAVGREAAAYEVKLEVEQDKVARELLSSKYKIKLSTPERKPFIERSEAIRQAFAKSVGAEATLKEIYSLAK